MHKSATFFIVLFQRRLKKIGKKGTVIGDIQAKHGHSISPRIDFSSIGIIPDIGFRYGGYITRYKSTPP